MYTEEYIRNNPDKVNWHLISQNQTVTENFIREFKDRVYWNYISYYQKLNEDFIREFKDKVSWNHISKYQKLSEDFIREFQDKVNWYNISQHQRLSEEFIREFKDKVKWHYISCSQILSEDFIEEFQNKINKEIQLKIHHNEFTLQQKQKIVKKYCDKYNLQYDKEYLYAFRKHDKSGCGIFNKTISYKKHKYYRDWRCDLDFNIQISFGYGIYPKGNIKVKVKIEDLGCWVNESNKLRVWGFEII